MGFMRHLGGGPALALNSDISTTSPGTPFPFPSRAQLPAAPSLPAHPAPLPHQLLPRFLPPQRARHHSLASQPAIPTGHPTTLPPPHPTPALLHLPCRHLFPPSKPALVPSPQGLPPLAPLSGGSFRHRSPFQDPQTQPCSGPLLPLHWGAQPSSQHAVTY